MNLSVSVLLMISLSVCVASQEASYAAPGPQAAKPSKVPAQTAATRASREVPDTYKGRVLTVGSGGGIRGQETSYALLDDGRLFRQNPGKSTYVFIGQQTTANTKKVFWSVEDRAAIKKTTYDKPRNVYRFVRWKKGREAYRVTWVPEAKDVPAYYEQVYTGFIGMIPPASR